MSTLFIYSNTKYIVEKFNLYHHCAQQFDRQFINTKFSFMVPRGSRRLEWYKATKKNIFIHEGMDRHRKWINN